MGAMPLRVIVAVLAMAAAGCGGATTPTDLTGLDFEASGCGDIFVYWASGPAEDEHVVEVIWDGLIGQAAARGTITETVALPRSGVSVVYRRGAHLSELDCNDVVVDEPVERARLLATSGTATITVTPEGDVGEAGEPFARTSLVLEDVVFGEGDDAVRLADLRADDVRVGWLPG